MEPSDTTENLAITFRSANKDDISFIFNSWLKSFRNSQFAKFIPNPTYFTEHHKVIEKLILNNLVLIACDPKDEKQIYGWVCAGLTEGIFTLHYIYVKHTYRKLGIAKAMLNEVRKDDAAAVCTHLTHIGSQLTSKYNLLYSPYVALTADYDPRLSKTSEESNE